MTEPKGKVLLVDDNFDTIEILVFALTEYGYEIEAAKNGKQALALAPQFIPEVILLDVMLPDMDGYTICRQLKQMPALVDVPVIFISSLHDTLDKLKAFKAGAVDYLTKPLEFEEVIARANAHMTLYRQRCEIERLLIEREKAEKAEREQRRLVDALLKIATVMNSTLDLKEVLRHMLENVGWVVEHDTALVITFDNGWGQVTGWHTYRADQEPISTEERFPTAEVLAFQTITQTREALITNDTEDNPYWLHLPILKGIHSSLNVPIFSEDQIFGVLILLKTEVNFYTPAMASRAADLAIYASIAIKNARLYEQSQALAVLEERQRLARELHDSVTQMLYSANNMAQSVLRFIDKKPEKAREYLEQLAQTTQGAMAEMRSLLFELRPEAITQSDLAGVLEMLSHAFTGKTGITVQLETSPGLILAPDLQMTFYRTMQEAFNNISRHANASHVYVGLKAQAAQVELIIEDNGCGFDLEHVPSGHFGVAFMVERAAKVGAELSITSQLQHGTRIVLRKSS